MAQRIRIGVVAPGGRIDEALAARVARFASDSFLDLAPQIFVHPQCFLSDGHFAGSDEERAAAFVEVANDPSIDAVWIARGGYGACRIAERVIAQLGPVARAKSYLGYSDFGALLGGLYAQGFQRLAHGPMLVDMTREDGHKAIKRALDWLISRAPEARDVAAMFDGKTAAFNITVLSSILGTPLEPDLSGHVLMLEDVGEYHYRIDRSMFHITSQDSIRKVRGIKLGRISDVPDNDRPFGAEAEEIAQYWCERSGIAYLGRADIGHDVENKVVPFGGGR